MQPRHRFEEEPFSQTSATSYVGNRISNAESFDPLVDIQSQINAITPSGGLAAQVAANTAAIETLNTEVETLNTEVSTISDSGGASFQQAYISTDGGATYLPLTTGDGTALYVWAHT